MTFNELMDGLAAKYSIDGLAADGGILSLQIDGMSVTIVEGGDDAFVVTGFVCDPPAENGELFANMLLDATIGLMDARAKANRVLPRQCTGHNKHPLPTTQEKTLHMDVTRWATSISD